jgi:hypothetical protein
MGRPPAEVYPQCWEPGTAARTLADCAAMHKTRTVEPANLRVVATGLRFPEGAFDWPRAGGRLPFTA